MPDGSYCNDGVTTDDFSYTLNGGSEALVSVTVTCVDDPPTAVDDAAAVAEDGPATPLTVLANDTDSDGGPMTIQSASDPADGTVAITGGGAGLSYRPDADHCNDGSPTDDFTYTLNGGSEATVEVAVSCVPDDPRAVDDSPTVTEDDGDMSVDPLDNDTDPDGGPMQIMSATQPNHGAVAITGGGTDISYEPDPQYCNSGSATDNFTYSVNGGSTATVRARVTCVDDLPTAMDDTAVVDEDSVRAIYVGANDADTDGGPKLVQAVSDPAHGTASIYEGGTSILYYPDPNYCNGGSPTDDFTYTLNGGSEALVEVTVNCLDEAANPTTPAPSPSVTASQQLTVHKVLVPNSMKKLLRKGVQVQATCKLDCRMLLTVGVARPVANAMKIRSTELARGTALVKAGQPSWVTAKVTGPARSALRRYSGGGRLQVNVQALGSNDPYAQVSFSNAPQGGALSARSSPKGPPLLLPEG
jgi:hypothetical protein